MAPVNPQARFHALSPCNPGWGSIATLPWDEDVFGFPVAELVLGDSPPDESTASGFATTLRDYCRDTRAELVSTRVHGDDTSLQSVLIRSGFFPVQSSLVATHARLREDDIPQRPRLSLRPADSADRERIVQIAATISGRYHGDPWFPRELANHRYAVWARRALEGADNGNLVFVIGPPAAPLGFIDVIIRVDMADLRLAAVDPSREAGFAGFCLFAESLRTACRLGARRATAKISATNTRVMNVYAALGFRFSQPELVLHWHAPNAEHLLPHNRPFETGSIGA